MSKVELNSKTNRYRVRFIDLVYRKQNKKFDPNRAFNETIDELVNNISGALTL